MDKILKRLVELAATEPLHKNCEIKIRRAEISPPMAYIRGTEIGARDLAIELLELLGGIPNDSNQ